MRILFLNPTVALGGAERSLLDLLAGLRDQDSGLELHVLAGAEGPLLERARLLGASTHVSPLPPALSALGESGVLGQLRGSGRARLQGALRVANALRVGGAYALKMAAMVREIRPALVHSNAIKGHLLSALVTPRGTPILWHVRDYLSERPLTRALLRPSAWRVAQAIAISRSLADDVRTALPRLPVEVIYNGVDLAHFRPDGVVLNDLDRRAGLPPAGSSDVLRVGLVATYSRWKGHHLFLEAAAHIAERCPGARFYAIGGPIYGTAGSQLTASELTAQARAHHLEQRFGIVPFQEDPAPVYRALDIVVHASTRREPFGRTIVEAMACGRPVVAANGGGSAELFVHDVEAVGFEPGSATGLATAIEALARDPERRERVGAAGRAAALERYGHARVGAEVASLYRRLGIGSPGPSR